ncbi:hypothetical protein [Mycobacterium avium]|uniref:hypothetical protein n=1 Tax=Mycobacterium avium TaxID=1764 RepID=UPI000AC3067E|nr:hypothetical protein [Mycobacterium avium]
MYEKDYIGVILNPWRKHYQQFFREQAYDRDRPLWDRLAFLAWASARRNGHANFRVRELADTFGVGPNRISEAIATAKGKGLIGPESKPTCLVVPARIAEGGDGNEYEICGVHDARRVRGKPVKLDRFRPSNSPTTPTQIAVWKAVQRS